MVKRLTPSEAYDNEIRSLIRRELIHEINELAKMNTGDGTYRIGQLKRRVNEILAGKKFQSRSDIEEFITQVSREKEIFLKGQGQSERRVLREIGGLIGDSRTKLLELDKELREAQRPNKTEQASKTIPETESPDQLARRISQWTDIFNRVSERILLGDFEALNHEGGELSVRLALIIDSLEGSLLEDKDPEQKLLEDLEVASHESTLVDTDANCMAKVLGLMRIHESEGVPANQALRKKIIELEGEFNVRAKLGAPAKNSDNLVSGGQGVSRDEAVKAPKATNDVPPAPKVVSEGSESLNDHQFPLQRRDEGEEGVQMASKRKRLDSEAGLEYRKMASGPTFYVIHKLLSCVAEMIDYIDRGERTDIPLKNRLALLRSPRGFVYATSIEKTLFKKVVEPINSLYCECATDKGNEGEILKGLFRELGSEKGGQISPIHATLVLIIGSIFGERFTDAVRTCNALQSHKGFVEKFLKAISYQEYSKSGFDRMETYTSADLDRELGNVMNHLRGGRHEEFQAPWKATIAKMSAEMAEKPAAAKESAEAKLSEEEISLIEKECEDFLSDSPTYDGGHMRQLSELIHKTLREHRLAFGNKAPIALAEEKLISDAIMKAFGAKVEEQKARKLNSVETVRAESSASAAVDVLKLLTASERATVEQNQKWMQEVMTLHPSDQKNLATEKKLIHALWEHYSSERIGLLPIAQVRVLTKMISDLRSVGDYFTHDKDAPRKISFSRLTIDVLKELLAQYLEQFRHDCLKEPRMAQVSDIATEQLKIREEGARRISLLTTQLAEMERGLAESDSRNRELEVLNKEYEEIERKVKNLRLSTDPAEFEKCVNESRSLVLKAKEVKSRIDLLEKEIDGMKSADLGQKIEASKRDLANVQEAVQKASEVLKIIIEGQEEILKRVNRALEQKAPIEKAEAKVA